MFINSEEATTQQLKFISKVKRRTGDEVRSARDESTRSEDATADLYIQGSSLSIPAKFSYVDIEVLLQARRHSEELKEVLQRVHPWLSLHYGLSAVATIEKLYEAIIPKYYGQEAEIQILSPMTKGSLGTSNLNKVIQEKTNPASVGKAQILVGGRIFQEGDRIIQKRNNYDLNVFNGDIGKITRVDNEEMELSVSFKSGKEVKEVRYEKEHLL